jgi:AraC-like DNA-binding protein
MDVEADKLLAVRVRELLRLSFADHRCLTVHQCATALEISVRSLQRKLRKIGVTFSTLLDETRFDLARKKLLRSNHTIEEISLALGFSTQESFIRAFHRWSGVSPGEFRNENSL